jgi:nitrite reductase/ring-hydroxylating ferredoxin subunit
LQTNQMMLIHLNDKRIVIGKSEDGYVAFDDYCTHRGGTLADGAMICGTVQCPWHGSQFGCRTGAVKAGPAREPIKTYLLKESKGKIYLSNV